MTDVSYWSPKMRTVRNGLFTLAGFFTCLSALLSMKDYPVAPPALYSILVPGLMCDHGSH